MDRSIDLAVQHILFGVHSFLPFMTVLFVLISFSECFYVKLICVNSGDIDILLRLLETHQLLEANIKLTEVDDKSDFSQSRSGL